MSYETLESKPLPPLNGYDLTAHLEYDTDSTPHDAECYSPADIDAWQSDHWRYVTLVVTASRNGVKLGDHAIGGVEYGRLPGVTCDPLNDRDDLIDSLTSEAIGNAEMTFAALTEIHLNRGRAL